MKKLIVKLFGEPRKRRVVWVGLLVTSLAVLSIVGLTEARYVLQWKPDTVLSDAKAFYFTSDYLRETDPPVYKIANFAPASSQISFNLCNYADESRVSESDIGYTVQVKNNRTEGFIINSNGTISSAKQDKLVNLNIPSGNFGSDNRAEVTVTATANSPYIQTLSAVYELYQVLTDYQAVVYDAVGSNTLLLTITTQNQGGSITFTPPNGVLPDNTDSRLSISPNNACTFVAEPNAEYSFTLFKTAPATVYSWSSFSEGGLTP